MIRSNGFTPASSIRATSNLTTWYNAKIELCRSSTATIRNIWIQCTFSTIAKNCSQITSALKFFGRSFNLMRSISSSKNEDIK